MTDTWTIDPTVINELATVLQERDQRGDDYMQMAEAVLSALSPRSFVPREDYMRQVGRSHGLEAALRRAASSPTEEREVSDG